MAYTKEEFFYEPRSVSEITAGSTIVPLREVSRVDLVGLIDQVDSDIVLVLKDQLINYGKTPPNFLHSPNFLKRGKELHLPLPSAAQYCDESTAPVNLRRRMVAKMDAQENYCGFTWRGLRTDDKRKRKVHLDDCLAAGKLFAFSEQADDTDDKIRVKVYDRTYYAKTQGAAYWCDVPSRSSDRVYTFGMLHVPLVRSTGEYSIWTNLDTEGHDCKLKIARKITFRDAPSQVTFCPHETAAYFHIVTTNYPRDRKLMVQPFPLFTQGMVDFWKTLKTRVLIDEPFEDSKGRTRRKRRKLNMAEREVLLHNKVALHGHDAMLFARRKIKDYDWF